MYVEAFYIALAVVLAAVVDVSGRGMCECVCVCWLVVWHWFALDQRPSSPSMFDVSAAAGQGMQRA